MLLCLAICGLSIKGTVCVSCVSSVLALYLSVRRLFTYARSVKSVAVAS